MILVTSIKVMSSYIFLLYIIGMSPKGKKQQRTENVKSYRPLHKKIIYIDSRDTNNKKTKQLEANLKLLGAVSNLFFRVGSFLFHGEISEVS